ncbi:hypothetical protein F0562_031872 [Nyssa sinensis]|uniref:Uncharacterized protein n=1 Tax=Nyssa sinensis TaxID=561372 RepID=A0A5J5AY53_9ASTE|nr:hypothetical protein F0562_031872 [Nyssa sinensis]
MYNLRWRCLLRVFIAAATRESGGDGEIESAVRSLAVAAALKPKTTLHSMEKRNISSSLHDGCERMNAGGILTHTSRTESGVFSDEWVSNAYKNLSLKGEQQLKTTANTP